MALLIRVYYNAVYGALGGLLGWALFGIFGEKNPEGELGQALQVVLGGVCIGGCIGFFVVSVEAMRDNALIRMARLASYGVVLGSIGGVIGFVIGDLVKLFLNWLAIQLNFLPDSIIVEVITRGFGWSLLGVAIGMSEGIAAKSLGKFSYGTLGGMLGGFLGGCVFGLLYYIVVKEHVGSSYWANALGLVILGACIGSLSALVQGVFQPASVKVMRGWQEGREYPLEKPASLLGRDEHADIALFRDMKVEKKHAYVKRLGAKYVLVNNGAPADHTLVNDKPVYQRQELHDGDRIQLGNVLLRFQARAAVNRPKARRALPVAALAPRAGR